MRALILLIALSILSALPAFAADVLILQSGRGPAYVEAVRGFREALRGTSQTVVLADYAEVDVVRLVKEEQPRLVLAVGDQALAASKKVRNVPVVSLLALDLLKRGGSGISLLPAPERYLELCRSLGARRVGVLYDPARSGWYLEQARAAARTQGVELVVREVRRASEVAQDLEGLKGKVDALWMLPDATAVTNETADSWFNFAVSQQLPLVTFSEQYLKKGAVASLDIDRVDMGRQAAEYASDLLQKPDHPKALRSARKTRLNSNPAVSQRLGISLPAELR